MRQNIIVRRRKPYTIGRDEGNDCVLRSPYVSRHHAKIAWIKGQAYVNDQSTNGTYLNGSLVPKDAYIPVKDGDVISINKNYLADKYVLLVQIPKED